MVRPRFVAADPMICLAKWRLVDLKEFHRKRVNQIFSAQYGSILVAMFYVDKVKTRLRRDTGSFKEICNYSLSSWSVSRG